MKLSSLLFVPVAVGGLLALQSPSFGQMTGSATPAQSPAPAVTRITFPLLGLLATRDAHEIRGSDWSIGGETLDRDFARYDEYKKYLGPLGAKAIRLQGGWAKTEREKGVYSWEWLDQVVDDSTSRGLRPWIQLSYGNPIYPGGGTPNIGSPLPASDEAVHAWDAWVRALVRRYKDRVDTWEIWNEPDLFTKVEVKDYAAFFIRTAEIIRQEDPQSKIYALSLGHTPEYADQFLDEIDRLGKLHLIDAITFHHYPINPDDLSLLSALRQSVARHHAAIELREGENGAPSRPTTGALSGYSWTEVTQAKWDLRRMLAFHGNGVPFNLFTISDFLYPKGMNTKGLLEARPDHTVVGPKMAYRAVQRVFSLFDDTLKVSTDFEAKTNSNRPLAIYGYTTKDTGMSVLSVWEQGNPPGESHDLNAVDIELSHANFSNPVYINLLSGEVFDIPKDNWSKDNGRTVFKKIPVYDSPILIADRSLIKLVPAEKP